MFTPAIRAICVPASYELELRWRALTLALLVARICADHPHNAVAPDDLAIPAHFLYRCLYSHVCSSVRCRELVLSKLFRAEHDACACQIVRCEIHRNLV